MILKKIHLRGAKGIQRGMGVDEIKIDLTGLSGMVALDGGNGKGKTTVLDNLHPYRLLPSRPKRSLPHHFALEDSFRDLELEYMGDDYRFLIKIDGVRMKQEAYIYKNGSTKSEVSSKLGEYDEYLEKLFGTVELFMASTFCAQNTDDGKLTAGQLKKQYSEFLPLAEMQRHSDTAKQCKVIISGQVDAVENQITRMQEHAFGLSNAGDLVMEKKGQIAEQNVIIGMMKDTIADCEKELAEADKLQRKNELLKADLANIDKQIAAALSEKQVCNDEGVRIVRGIEQRISDIQDEAQKLATVCAGAADVMVADDKLKAATAQLKAMQTEIDEKNAAIKDAHEKHGDLSRWVKVRTQERADERIRLQSELESIRERITKKLGERTDLMNAHLKLENDPELRDLEFKKSMLVDKMADFDKRGRAHCTNDPDPTCQFIIGAIEAKAKLPAIDDAIKISFERVAVAREYINADLASCKIAMSNLYEDEKTKSKLISEFDETIKAAADTDELALSKIDAEIKGLNNDLETLEKDKIHLQARIRKLETDIERKPAIDAATVKLQSVNNRLAELETELKQAKDTRAISMRKTLVKIEALEKAKADIFIDPLADDRVVNLKNRLTKRNADIDAKKDHIASLRTDLALAEKDVETLKKLVDDIKERTARRDFLKTHAAEWQYLEERFGKNGMQALEIDSVAPTISGIANDLLASTFGPSFQVRMDTLNDAGKETLEIWVMRDDGTECLLEDHSGGEKVWILKALRLGRTMIAKEKSGKAVLTSFADEEDGPLRSGETSENFIGLYRSFLQMAGFEACFFISHKPECVAMADHVLFFDDGGVSIN
jgi:exonuclease SbcC